jgi:8-oxo-dGTP diphosphatase
MKWKPNTPYITVDGIVEIFNNKNEFQGIVLISRKNDPLGLAIPGGFVDIGETVENALLREMKEEISLKVEIKHLLNIYSDPKRDKRFHTVSIVYICKAYGIPIGKDDAKEATIYKLNSIPLKKLQFDHEKIINEYLEYNKRV